MQKLTPWFSLALAVALTAGCQRKNDELEKRLDRLEGKIDSLVQKVEGIGARPGMGPGQMPPRPPGPDPNAIYAVDITGDPCRGPETAKITIAEAAEFA